MSIAFDSSSSGRIGTSGSLTVAHTCTGSNLILFVSVTQQSNAVTPTATYNGVSMTLLTEQLYTNGRHGMFYLINPATGTHNIVVSASSDSKGLAAASYTGNGGGIDAETGNAVSVAGTGFTGALASVADNCWHIMGAGVQGNGVASTALTASTNATQRAVSNSVDEGAGIYDANSAKTPAGSVSEAITFASGRYGWTMATIKPLVAQTVTDAMTIGSTEKIKQGFYLNDIVTMSTVYLQAITDALGLTEITLKLKIGFSNLIKNAATMTGLSKNAATMTPQSKNAATFTPQDKN